MQVIHIRTLRQLSRLVHRDGSPVRGEALIAQFGSQVEQHAQILRGDVRVILVTYTKL